MNIFKKNLKEVLESPYSCELLIAINYMQKLAYQMKGSQFELDALWMLESEDMLAVLMKLEDVINHLSLGFPVLYMDLMQEIVVNRTEDAKDKLIRDVEHRAGVRIDDLNRKLKLIDDQISKSLSLGDLV